MPSKVPRHSDESRNWMLPVHYDTYVEYNKNSEDMVCCVWSGWARLLLTHERLINQLTSGKVGAGLVLCRC